MPAINFTPSKPVGPVAFARALCRLAVVVLLSIHAVSPAALADVRSKTIDFSRESIGTPPQDFEFWRAGEADPDHWAVVGDLATEGGLSVERSGGDRDLSSSLAVCKAMSAVNAKVRVQFKLIDGSLPSAGIAVRIASPNDYYLVRVSAFEARLALLHVVNGVPQEIAGVDADVTQNHWQSLEVVVNGNSFKMSLDERWALTAFDYDEPVGGWFGIWTERDDVVRFDHFEIAPVNYANGVEHLRRRAGGERGPE
jgi:hypothetical protein